MQHETSGTWRARLNVMNAIQEKTKAASHIDVTRLLDVIDGLEALTEPESQHLIQCKPCQEAARLASREIIRKRRHNRQG